MDRQEFGKLIAALRKDRIDLIHGGTWSQQDLAEETGLSAKIIGNIERGEKAHLEPDILVGLAEAFGLSTVERIRFYEFAASVGKAGTMASNVSIDEVLTEVLGLAEEVRLPVFVHDSFYNIVAYNYSWMRLSMLTHDFIKEYPNVMSLFYAPDSPFPKLFRDQYRSRLEVMRQLRYMSLPYRHRPRFRTIFKHIAQFRQFQTDWIATQVDTGDRYYTRRNHFYKHPDFGEMNFVTLTQRNYTPRGSLYLSVLIPNDDKSADVFHQLARDYHTTFRPIEWPDGKYSATSDQDELES